MQGYISLHRQIQNHYLWLSEPFTRAQAWVDLLLLANHDAGCFYVRGNRIDVERGEIARSEESLSLRWQWSRNKLRAFLKDLEKERQIEQQKTSAINKIKILNYDLYQKMDDRLNNRKTTERRQKDINNKDNNNNNDNNDISDFDDFWSLYPKKVAKQEAQRAYKKSLKETNHEALIAGLRKYVEANRGKDAQYIANAATWLNGKRWHDEQPSPTPSRTRMPSVAGG